MRWSQRFGAVLLGMLPLGFATAVLADGGGNSKLSVSQGTYYVTQIYAGAVAKVVVSSDGSVQVIEKWISGLPTGGPDSAVFAADGTMITGNFSAGTISRVDVNSRQVLQKQVNKVLYQGAVADLATDPKRNAVYFILRGDSSPRAVGRLDLGSGATQNLNPDGVSDLGGIAVSDDGSRLFVSSSSGYIAELSPSSGHVIRKTKVDGSPDGMSWDPSNGNLFASSCAGICMLSTGGNGGSSLTLVKVLDAADGDGIAADGQGHVYIAESSCGSLCRLDVATNTTVTVAETISGADDVTPVAGAGSSGGACLALVSCLGGAGSAGLAAAGIGLIAFMGAAGFTALRPAPAHMGGMTTHHAGAPAHGAAGAPAHGATSGGPAGHDLGTGPPAGHEAVSAGGEGAAGHLQEEAGDKLLEIGGAGLEVSAAGPAPPPVPSPPPTEGAPSPSGPPGASRVGHDDEDEQTDPDQGPSSPPPAPSPPPV